MTAAGELRCIDSAAVTSILKINQQHIKFKDKQKTAIKAFVNRKDNRQKCNLSAGSDGR